jgi:hypothetical protein
VETGTERDTAMGGPGTGRDIAMMGPGTDDNAAADGAAPAGRISEGPIKSVHAARDFDAGFFPAAQEMPPPLPLSGLNSWTEFFNRWAEVPEWGSSPFFRFQALQ